MTFDELMSSGWRDHDTATAAVADRLTEHALLTVTPEHAARYAALVVHTVGQHHRDWQRAARLATTAIERVASSHPKDPALAPAWASAAAAQHLAGDPAGAMVSELRSATASPTDALGHLLRPRMLVAEALLAADRRAEAAAMFETTLDAWEALPPSTTLDRAVAAGGSNITTSLLNLTDRSREEDALVARGADAARTAWRRVGTWMNHERADYLVALAMNALGRHRDAVAAARAGLETIRANGEEQVDEAFLNLTLCAAARGLRDRDLADSALAAADALARGFADDEGLRTWFADERAKLPPNQ
jgi:hypothetical protein